MRKCMVSSFSFGEPITHCRGGCNRSPPFSLRLCMVGDAQHHPGSRGDHIRAGRYGEVGSVVAVVRVPATAEVTHLCDPHRPTVLDRCGGMVEQGEDRYPSIGSPSAQIAAERQLRPQDAQARNPETRLWRVGITPEHEDCFGQALPPWRQPEYLADGQFLVHANHITTPSR